MSKESEERTKKDFFCSSLDNQNIVGGTSGKDFGVR